MNKDTGGPAFPELGQITRNPDWQSESGMTVRDYFAAKAIDMATIAEAQAPCGENGETTYRGIAERCYLLADAMLMAREK
jgi:hypothetical protein